MQQWVVKRAAAGTGVVNRFVRTLVLKDLTVGNDIADHVTAYAAGAGSRIAGVLRKAITADLTVRVNLNGAEYITITVPSSTAVDTPVEQTTFTGSSALIKDDVFSWDITASDGSQDGAGVATFTLEWV